MGDGPAISAAPGHDTGVLVVQDWYDYDAKGFDAGFRNRFAGRVYRRGGEIQLVVRCVWAVLVDDWLDRSGAFRMENAKDLARYQQLFKAVVEQGWSGAWALEPSYPFDKNYRFRTRVIIEAVDAGQDHHLKIYLRSGDTNVRSNAGVEPAGADPDGNRILNLKLESPTEASDVALHTVPFPPPPQASEQSFSRCTAVHEFGHHIGLHHPRPEWDKAGGDEQLKAYGETAAEADCVMGWGSLVKKEDCEPFLQVARRYAAELAPNENRNKWSVVPNNQ
jgi:hypothetical protein